MSSAPAEARSDAQAATSKQLRGSSLLLAGRLLSKLVNFGVQVAIVRLLSKDDFGVFAYGLALVLAGELSIIGALAAGEFAAAHQRLARGMPGNNHEPAGGPDAK